MNDIIKDKRRFKRYRKNLPGRILDGRAAYTVRIVDFSLDGLGVEMAETIGVDTGDILDIDSEELSLHGSCKVEWCRRTPAGVRLGLHKLAPLAGSLKIFSLPDILVGLQRSLKDGTLRITSGTVEKKVYISKGDIIFASSNLTEDRLGNILLREGRITQSAFDITSKLMPLTGKKQGALLVETKSMTAKDLTWAVKHQVAEIILSLFTLRDASFEFSERGLKSEEVITLKVPAGHLIYSGLKRAWEAGLLTEAAGLSSGTILAFSRNPLDLFQDIPFDENDRTILSCIDGRRDLGEIIKLSGFDDAAVRRSLSILLNTAIVEAVEEEVPGESVSFDYIISKVEAPPGLVEKIQEIHGILPDLNYYSLFGVEESASEDDLRRAFYKTAKEFHPDRHFYLGEDLKERLHDILSYCVRAYTILSSPEKRAEYDSSISGKKHGVSRVALAQARFDEGVRNYKKGRLEEALLLFKDAIQFDNREAGYHYFSALALSGLGRLKEAERALSRACKMSPDNDEYYAEQGHVFLRLGLPSRARISFMKALRSNVANKRAQEGLLSVQ